MALCSFNTETGRSSRLFDDEASAITRKELKAAVDAQDASWIHTFAKTLKPLLRDPNHSYSNLLAIINNETNIQTDEKSLAIGIVLEKNAVHYTIEDNLNYLMQHFKAYIAYKNKKNENEEREKNEAKKDVQNDENVSARCSPFGSRKKTI